MAKLMALTRIRGLRLPKDQSKTRREKVVGRRHFARLYPHALAPVASKTKAKSRQLNRMAVHSPLQPLLQCMACVQPLLQSMATISEHGNDFSHCFRA